MSKSQEMHLKAFYEAMPDKRWSIFEQREIDYGVQLSVYRGTDMATINFYLKGTIVVQGKHNELKEELVQWKEEREGEQVKQQKTLWEI